MSSAGHAHQEVLASSHTLRTQQHFWPTTWWPNCPVTTRLEQAYQQLNAPHNIGHALKAYRDHKAILASSRPCDPRPTQPSAVRNALEPPLEEMTWQVQGSTPTRQEISPLILGEVDKAKKATKQNVSHARNATEELMRMCAQNNACLCQTNTSFTAYVDLGPTLKGQNKTISPSFITAAFEKGYHTLTHNRIVGCHPKWHAESCISAE